MVINAELEKKIVSRLFDDAVTNDWTYLTGDQRSAVYDRWVTDPDVGGRLGAFMTPEKARVWIKDGPMKEYARARYGVGKYAALVANPAAGVAKLVERALGADWSVVDSKCQIKPLRVRIQKGDSERHFAWAPSKDLKHLVWAAIKAEAWGDTTPWTLCLEGSFEQPIPSDEKQYHARISRRTGLEIVHVDGH